MEYEILHSLVILDDVISGHKSPVEHKSRDSSGHKSAKFKVHTGSTGRTNMGIHLVQGFSAASTGSGVQPPTYRSVAQCSTAAPPQLTSYTY